MGEPLLWHDLTLGSDGLSRHADPSALDPRASQGMVAVRVGGATTSWVGAATSGAKGQGQA